MWQQDCFFTADIIREDLIGGVANEVVIPATAEIEMIASNPESEIVTEVRTVTGVEVETIASRERSARSRLSRDGDNRKSSRNRIHE